MSIMMPGEAAVLTLSDKFIYVSLAMLVTALVAAAQWDALAIDYRDAVILQPLPIRPAALRLAKLTAVAALGAGVAVAVNVFPTIVFPWMLAFAVPQMSASQLLQLIITQAVITVGAAIFGFLGWLRFANGRARCSATACSRACRPGCRRSRSCCSAARCCCCRWCRRGSGSAASPGGGRYCRRPLSSARTKRRPGISRRPAAREDDRAAGRAGQGFTAIYAERRPLFAPLARRARALVAGVVLLVGLAPPSTRSGLRRSSSPQRGHAGARSSPRWRGSCFRAARRRARGSILRSPPCGATRPID